MKTITLFLCALTICTSALSQSNADLGLGAMGLVVSDLEASEHFYKDILGMIDVGGFSLDEQWSQEAGASNGQPFAVKQLKLKDTTTATVLKLAYFDQEVARQEDKKSINSSSGVNYITFYYSAAAFQSAIARLDAAGIEKVGWVKRDRYQLIFVKDPDGVFVELIGPPEE